MTCIILLEGNAELLGVYNAHDRIINYHVSATGARYQDQLNDRIYSGAPIDLEAMSEEWPHSEYLNIITELNETYPVWSIRDDRVILLLDDFAAIVSDARLLWIDDFTSSDEYLLARHELAEIAFNDFDGPKLHSADGSDWSDLL